MTADELINSLKRMNATAEAFAAGLRIKIDQYAVWMFGGRRQPITTNDQSLRLKDLLAAASVFDREVLTYTPANLSWHCRILRGWPQWLWRSNVQLVATMAVDLNEIVLRATAADRAAQDWPALPAAAMDAALDELGTPPPRTFLAVCSPSGFTDEAVELASRRASSLASAGGGLVLVHPRDDGGWALRTFDTDEHAPPMPEAPYAMRHPWHFIFDPETVDDKIKRIRKAIEAGSLDLAERGLSVGELADRLQVPRELVNQVFITETDARSDYRLRQLDGDLVLLGRHDLGPAKPEKNMSMFQKLRELLGLSGQEARKIELLGDKRALLNARRDRLYRELDELGDREQTLLGRGIAADSKVMQRRLAGELAQVRRRIEQGNTMVGLVNRQIDALATHMHHLTLLAQGSEVQMPSIEEMTRDAVRAEELIERIRADADVVESLGEVTGTSLDSVSEEQILAEFAAARQVQGQRQVGADESAGPQRTPAQSVRPQRAEPQRSPERDKPLKE